jgi:hypothetical protein
MTAPNDTSQCPSPEPTAAPRRWLGRSFVAGVIVAAGLAVGACGSSESTDSTTMLNTGEVEQAIEQSSMDQRGIQAEVSCPSDVVQKMGSEFSCEAAVGSDSTEFVVTQLDMLGHVHYQAP